MTKEYLIRQLKNFQSQVLDKVYSKASDLQDVTKKLSDHYPHYNIMPSKDKLLAMDSGFFHIYGYYDGKDGNGGDYYISTTSVSGAVKLTNDDGSVVRYLIALDADNSRMNQLNVCRYGVRPSSTDINGASMTVEKVYAEQNSDIIASLLNNVTGRIGMTLYFPAGRYYFSRPLDISSRHANLVGAYTPELTIEATQQTGGGYICGSTLIFPWLTDGQIAVISGRGNIENLVICGNPLTYSYTVYTAKTVTAPEEVIVETIGEVTEGEQTQQQKCTGLHKSQAGTISNVAIYYFYTGCYLYKDYKVITDNLSLTGCHTGVRIGSNKLCTKIHGRNVSVLMSVEGSNTSISSVYAHQCSSVARFQNANRIVNTVLEDITSAYCAQSLIIIGNSSKIDVRNCQFKNLHGIWCALKSFDPKTASQPAAKDASLQDYGVISVLSNASLVGCTIDVANLGKVEPISSTTYVTPSILLTYSSKAEVQNNVFQITGADIGVGDDFRYEDYLTQLIPITDALDIRVDTADGTFIIANGNIIYPSHINEVTMNEGQIISQKGAVVTSLNAAVATDSNIVPYNIVLKDTITDVNYVVSVINGTLRLVPFDAIQKVQNG